MNHLFYRCFLAIVKYFDAERVHEWSLRALAFLGRIARFRILRTPLKIVVTGNCPHCSSAANSRSLNREVFGLNFSNPVGLAAGLDKDAEAIEGLALLGFGFLEVGTVTPLAQKGNSKPRLFRNYKEQIIFNAMGFNNYGAAAMLEKVRVSKPHLTQILAQKCILGINIGKNALTPLEDAAKDYRSCVQTLSEVADYFTINVSSPNTSGLRGLQSFENLAPILDGVFEELHQQKHSRPVLIKLAPEIKKDDLAALVSKIEFTFPVAGWIITNTLLREAPWKESAMKQGGLSGLVLIDEARRSLVDMKQISSKPIISSGGIVDVNEAKKRLDLGASLIQLYSGLIFRGPSFVPEILKHLGSLD